MRTKEGRENLQNQLLIISNQTHDKKYLTNVEQFTLKNIQGMIKELMLDWDKNTEKLLKEEESAKNKTFRTDQQ